MFNENFFKLCNSENLDMKQPYVDVIGIWGCKDSKRIRTQLPGVGQLQ